MLLLTIDGKFIVNGNIMAKTKYSAKELVKLFHREKVLTLDDLKKALATKVNMTVFRKMSTLSYRSSYSHAGKYYTLDGIADYSENGLWSYGQIYFSKYGSLRNTVEAFVCASEAGCFAFELQELLHIPVHKPLRELFSSDKLHREQLSKRYLYLSPVKTEFQLNNRKAILEAAVLEKSHEVAPEFASSEVQKALRVFLSTLNEKQRRLYAGFESMKLGYGGDTVMAKITGMNIKTIARGRKKLLAHDITPDNIREPGAGRPALEKKQKS